MEEFDLNSAWKSADEKADAFYASIEPEVIDLARKKSNSILAELKRKVIWEWITGIVVWIGIMIIYRNMNNYLGFVLFGLIVFVLSWLPYKNLFLKLKETPTQNMINCIEAYIDILKNFISRIKVLTLVLIPIGFCAGLFLFMEQGAEFKLEKIQWAILAKLTVFTAIFLAGLFWIIFKWYVPKIYGKPKADLESILKSLKQEQ